jgi:hypothetical protein
MRWLSPVFVLLCLSACFKSEARKLLGPILLDSSGATMKSDGSLRNVEKARIVVVVEHPHPEPGTPPDTCGSPSLLLTADVEMSDGHRVVLSGRGASPCNAGTPPIVETIYLESQPPGDMSKGKTAGIRLRSSKPVILRSTEWQTWEQGL